HCQSRGQPPSRRDRLIETVRDRLLFDDRETAENRVPRDPVEPCHDSLMRVVIEAASLALSSGGLARYTSELSLAVAHCFPDDEFFLISDQPFQMPSGAPPNLKHGGGPRNAIERRGWLWGIASEMRRLNA